MGAQGWLSDAAPVVLGAIAGSLIAFIGSWMERRWRRKDAVEEEKRVREREKLLRLETRAEAAANKLLDLIDNLANSLSAFYLPGQFPESGNLISTTQAMRTESIHLGDSEARKRIEAIARTFEHLHAIQTWQGESVAVTAHKLRSHSRNVLGHVLNGEPLEDREFLDEYIATIEEDRRVWLERAAEMNRGGDVGSPPE